MSTYKIGQQIDSIIAPRTAPPRAPDSGVWCVVRAESQREKTAEASLRDAGYGVYAPRYKVRMRDRTRHRRMIVAVRPLFGALRVRAVRSAHRALVPPRQAARGVRSLVKLGASTIVPAAAVEALRRKEADNFGCAYRVEQLLAKFTIGDPVRINEGPFAGLDGIIDAVLAGTIDGETGIVALANLFGRVVRISGLSADDVERLQSATSLPRNGKVQRDHRPTGPSPTKTVRGAAARGKIPVKPKNN
jgi:transcription antitermination factor NusG